jgi:hypothetical protein
MILLAEKLFFDQVLCPLSENFIDAQTLNPAFYCQLMSLVPKYTAGVGPSNSDKLRSFLTTTSVKLVLLSCASVDRTYSHQGHEAEVWQARVFYSRALYRHSRTDPRFLCNLASMSI